MKLISAALFCYLLYSFPVVFSAVPVNLDCPPNDETTPCECKDLNKRILTCENILGVPSLRRICLFEDERYRMDQVYIKSSSMPYIPHEIFNRFLMDHFVVEDMMMSQLFDELPEDASSVKNFTLQNVSFLRSLDWSLLDTMRNLKSLIVAETAVQVLGETFKTYVPSDYLELIFFRDSETRKIEPGTLADFENLQVIRFENCKLNNLRRDMFPKEALYLKEVAFDNNNISSIPKDLFNNMPALLEVSLRNNSLTTIPEEAFTGSPIENYLRLDDNPLRCNCALQWMFKGKKGDPPTRTGTCATPDFMNNKTLFDLTEDDFECEN